MSMEDVAETRCPECIAGKCGNCDGSSWSYLLDSPATCPCASAVHFATDVMAQNALENEQERTSRTVDVSPETIAPATHREPAQAVSVVAERDGFESEAASQQERAEVAEAALSSLRGRLSVVADVWARTHGPEAGYPLARRECASTLRAVLRGE